MVHPLMVVKVECCSMNSGLGHAQSGVVGRLVPYPGLDKYLPVLSDHTNNDIQQRRQHNIKDTT